MEYSPTAEMNRIYSDGYRLIDPTNRTLVTNSRQWFQDALTSTVKENETVASRAFTRPIAENILALIISPQLEINTSTGSTASNAYSIAPQYLYDSALVTNPGATATGGQQGTQHMLPPLLKVSMIALDHRAGETLSSDSELREAVLTATSALFKQAAQYEKDLEGADTEPGTLEQLLVDRKLNYRVFTTTIALKQSRWSF